jgi:hemerythrin-like metal-binding protein
MSVIKWRDTYNTGVAQFDREHHKLVELIDLMYGAIRDKSGKEVAEKACTELVAYTIYHFENEEKAMAEVNFPNLEEHKAEHTRLKQEAQTFHARINSSFPEGATKLYHFLRDWLITHIQDCDKKYGQALSGRLETE